MQSEDDEWICPSFNSYSQNNSAEIATRVIFEADIDAQSFHQNLHSIAEDEDTNFEFAFLLDNEFEVTSNDAISSFPVFNGPNCFGSNSNPEETVKVPLQRLFIEEEQEAQSSSSSSSEADEMESIPPGSYCVWKPKVTVSPSTCKKSKSTGFGSKRWKLRDLLRRSNSEGKDSFVFLTPKKKEDNSKIRKSNATKTAKGSCSSVSVSTSASPTRRLIYSPANRDIMRGNETPNRSQMGNAEMQKRKSYLPYRQDLVGFFTTVNSLGRNFSSLKIK